MRVAYFTPISPQKTGVSDYSQNEILPYIKNYIDLDIFIDKNIIPTNPFILENFNTYSYEEYIKRKNQYDIAIYHMGNNGYHKYIYESLIRNPGITVLHDIYLHGFLWNYTLSIGNEERYIEEFKYCYGEVGSEIAKKAIKLGVYPEFEYPLIKKIIDNSLGVVCHSDFGVKKTLNECDSVPIKKINQPFTVSGTVQNADLLNKSKLKIKYNLEGKSPIISSFGYIFTHKRYHILLRVFKKFLEYYPDSLLLLIGKDLMRIAETISDLDLKESIITTGYAPHESIQEYLAISDFCINLRYPTAGETSRSVLQLMAAEKPVIVSNVGWFSEIPDNCCLKVDVDSYEGDILLEYMKLLASNEGIRKLIGKNAKEYVLKGHDPEKIAKEYYMYIKNILNGNELILNTVSRELTNFGLEDYDTEIIEYVSERITNII